LDGSFSSVVRSDCCVFGYAVRGSADGRFGLVSGRRESPDTKAVDRPGFEMNDDIQPPKQKTEDKGARRAGQKFKENTRTERTQQKALNVNTKMAAEAGKMHQLCPYFS
jgi:hypothetical protein